MDENLGLPEGFFIDQSEDEVNNLPSGFIIDNAISIPTGNEENNTLEDIVGGVSSFSKGSTFGLGDKAGGAVNAFGKAVVAPFFGKDPIEEGKKGYHEIVDASDIARGNFSKRNSKTSFGLELGGSIVNPLSLKGGKYLLNAAKATPKATSVGGKLLNLSKNVGRSSIVGAGESGLASAMQSDDFSDIPENFAEGTTAGALIGAGFPLAGSVLKQGSKVIRGSGNIAEDIATRWGAGRLFSRGADEIKDGIETLAPSGQGNLEVLGGLVRDNASEGVEKIKDIQNKLYDKINTSSNMFGESITDNTRQIINELRKESTGKGQKYLDEIAKEIQGTKTATDEGINFLKNLKSKEVKELKLQNPDEYLALLEEIAQREKKTPFRRENGTLEHFVKNSPRKNYIHTSSDTINNPDIVGSGNNLGFSREYLVKKYKNDELGKDLFDIIVKNDKNEVITKYPHLLKTDKDYGYVARQIENPRRVSPLGNEAMMAPNTETTTSLISNNVPKFVDNVNPNISQLRSLKSNIGDDFSKNSIGLNNSQIGRIYSGLEKDIEQSLVKNALPSKEGSVVGGFKRANNYFKAQKRQQSPQSILESFANKKGPDSTLGADFLRKISSRNTDMKSVNILFKKASNKEALKSELISNITSKRQFNNIPMEGKKKIYGDLLSDADNLFNGAPGDILGNWIGNGLKKFENSNVSPRLVPGVSIMTGGNNN